MEERSRRERPGRLTRQRWQQPPSLPLRAAFPLSIASVYGFTETSTGRPNRTFICPNYRSPLRSGRSLCEYDDSTKKELPFSNQRLRDLLVPSPPKAKSGGCSLARSPATCTQRKLAVKNLRTIVAQQGCRAARERLRLISGLLHANRGRRDELPRPETNRSIKQGVTASNSKTKTLLPFLDFQSSRPATQDVPAQQHRQKAVGWGKVGLKWNVDSQGLPRRTIRLQSERQVESTALRIRRLCSMDSSSGTTSENRPPLAYGETCKTAKTRLGRTFSFGGEARHASVGRVIAGYGTGGVGKEVGVGTCTGDLDDSKSLYFNLSVHFSKVRIHRKKDRATLRRRTVFKAETVHNNV